MFTVFGILAGAIALFAWGRPRVDIVAILVVLALMLSRVLTPREAFAGFGDPVVVLIAAIFIVGEALVNTGVELALPKVNHLLTMRYSNSDRARSNKCGANRCSEKAI